MRPVLESVVRWAAHWQQRPLAERRRLVLGGLLILALLFYLVLQDKATARPEPLLPWPELMAQAQALSLARPLEVEQWQQQAAHLQMVLLEAEAGPGDWSLKGEASSPDRFLQLLAWSAQQGWWPRQWRMQQTAEGLLFELRVEALNR